MIHIGQLKEMVGITSLDKLEIERFQDHLLGKENQFNETLESWALSYDLHCGKDDSLLLPNYYKSLIAGAYQDDFYVIQYHQALHWLNCGLTQNRIMLILSQMRKNFILYSEEVNSNTLAKGLCHVLDVGQSIVSSVFMVSESIERMKNRSDNEIRRLKNSYRLIAVDVPEDILQAYIDHQQWKMLAFELSLGRDVQLDQFQRSHLDCNLGKWLERWWGLNVFLLLNETALMKSMSRCIVWVSKPLMKLRMSDQKALWNCCLRWKPLRKK